MFDIFKAISLSHKTAPLAVRELIALSEDEAKRLMHRLRDFFGLSELLVVSTCNRTEVYYTSAQDQNEAIARLLLIEKGLTDTDTYLPYFQQMPEHAQAVRHLFEVCVGLHSQVIGDMQIPNQVKQSYQWSADLDLAGPFIHRLMHTIFFTNKRVAQETSFRDGAASVSYAAVELIDELVGEHANPAVLVVGLGEIGADVCRNLVNRGIKNVVLCNRTRSKAEELAQELNLGFADFDQLAAEVQKADVIISAVQRDEPLFTPTLLRDITVLTYKYFIDLSVPRSIDAAVEQIPGVLVYNIDHIRNRADEALNRRLASIPQVEMIIGQSVAEFGDWSKEMMVSPTINKLKNALEQIRKEEIARHMKHLSTDESEKVDKITRGIMQKVLKLPVLQLKAACKRGEAETLIDVLNDLFNLEGQSADVPTTH
ncbi:glutamyl-tRNA reductase [Fibrella aestuarina BUZ 2]|uniref:Glutamyl-tRNA reductase n=1 Tax=Fibrella aestuarina BUZ 2 TaxID=1166018 RepID=I0K4I5_9BACT|nr:glutamyl-tRNA reductase [Fibrella aestuarina]CCG99038.1 glutamyl-tRNA reductase [Fibrella aestuarina BUZ 2]